MSDSIAKRFGLPENLEPDQVADALEAAAGEIRRAGTHEGFLLDVLADQEEAKRDDDLIRALIGRGEAE
jgi:2-keto-3-deoxy-L-rhamnonate aldolase RhmA